MHRSRLCGFIIDCQTRDLEGAAEFWSAALGMRREALPGEEGQRYVRLRDGQRGMHIEVQTVTHPSRVHLDVETDDVEAEVCRLEALGATRVNRGRNWWVMQAPTGHRFCVVPAEGVELADGATAWP